MVDLSSQISFYGYINTIEDAKELIRMCHCNEAPLATRRPSLVNPGTVYCYTDGIGIQRWTDKRIWSLSKTYGGFLLYRELNPDKTSKKGGLFKKTVSMAMFGKGYHVVAYTRGLGVAKPAPTSKTTALERVAQEVLISRFQI